MASFDSVNYSIRPSKSVQRGIVFQGLRRIFDVMDLGNTIYVGFGSIWFTDFVQAHNRPCGNSPDSYGVWGVQWIL